MVYADMRRVASLLEAHGIDGLLVVSPENFAYFTGVPGGPATMWRRVGPVAAVVLPDGQITCVVPDAQAGAVARGNPAARVLSHTLWIERVEVDPAWAGTAEELIARATAGRAIVRPEIYDKAVVFDLIRTAVADAGLLGRRVGVELEFAPAADMARLEAVLDGTELVDSSPLIRELRVIKTPREIELLRVSTQLAERGITGALEGLSEQTTALDIFTRYQETVFLVAREERILGVEAARTMVHLGPALWGTGDPLYQARRGDLIQFDSGVHIRGYESDIGRTFVFGRPTDAQRRIEDALLAGYEAGVAALRPGNRFCDVFHATQEAVRAAGFPSYTRGHVGHSIGGELFGEEWPWLSATEERVLEPGMVIAFEVPYYVNGIGGFQNEDNFLITETGNEPLGRLPMELVVVGD